MRFAINDSNTYVVQASINTLVKLIRWTFYAKKKIERDKEKQRKKQLKEQSQFSVAGSGNVRNSSNISTPNTLSPQIQKRSISLPPNSINQISFPVPKNELQEYFKRIVNAATESEVYTLFRILRKWFMNHFSGLSLAKLRERIRPIQAAAVHELLLTAIEARVLLIEKTVVTKIVLQSLDKENNSEQKKIENLQFEKVIQEEKPKQQIIQIKRKRMTNELYQMFEIIRNGYNNRQRLEVIRLLMEMIEIQLDLVREHENIRIEDREWKRKMDRRSKRRELQRRKDELFVLRQSQNSKELIRTIAKRKRVRNEVEFRDRAEQRAADEKRQFLQKKWAEREFLSQKSVRIIIRELINIIRTDRFREIREAAAEVIAVLEEEREQKKLAKVERKKKRHEIIEGKRLRHKSQKLKSQKNRNKTGEYGSDLDYDDENDSSFSKQRLFYKLQIGECAWVE
ncbi:MAG: hypothetical protein EZS28_009615 [Streblomastix strix]|uniref:Uncharacterized protein n=1 Tax=Streblomastix strix TaxID=222440 RepID=A0A5J4WJ34_9EUKA|nr:MAG: hypothetical protein EZS28_009615 [Streblomastix strix]